MSLSACGTGAQRSLRSPNATADPPAAHRGYLNDGDEDSSNDEDEDNLEGRTRDQDNDSAADHLKTENGSYHDEDDASIVAFGKRAIPPEERLIAKLAERYYLAAMNGDGAAGCSLLVPSFAKSLPGDYGKSPGPVYLRGRTCAIVLRKAFEHSRAQLTERFSATEARVEGNRGIALLGSENKPASYVMVEHAPSGWGVINLVPTVLP